jgi:hypothetical protein
MSCLKKCSNKKFWKFYRFRSWLCQDIIKEILTDLFHPEFGSEWKEPDGACYLAYQSGIEEGRRQKTTNVKVNASKLGGNNCEIRTNSD